MIQGKFANPHDSVVIFVLRSGGLRPNRAAPVTDCSLVPIRLSPVLATDCYAAREPNAELDNRTCCRSPARLGDTWKHRDTVIPRMAASRRVPRTNHQKISLRAGAARGPAAGQRDPSGAKRLLPTDMRPACRPVTRPLLSKMHLIDAVGLSATRTRRRQAGDPRAPASCGTPTGPRWNRGAGDRSPLPHLSARPAGRREALRGWDSDMGTGPRGARGGRRAPTGPEPPLPRRGRIQRMAAPPPGAPHPKHAR